MSWITDRPSPIERLSWLKDRIEFDAIIDIGSGDVTGHDTYFITQVFPDLPRYNFDKDPRFGDHSTIIELGTDHKLDDILSNALFNNAFYKIDVDGPEIAILNGSTKILQNTSEIMIECGLDDGKFLNICNWMRDNGWALIDVIEPVYRKSMILVQVDLVFVKPSIFTQVERTCWMESPDGMDD